MTPSDIIYRENIKPLYFCCGIPTGKRNVSAIKNLIKYNQSFIAEIPKVKSDCDGTCILMSKKSRDNTLNLASADRTIAATF